MRNSNLVWMGVVGFGLMAAGCADKNQKDYDSEVVQQDLHELQTQAGTYTGSVATRGQTPGALELTLNAEIRTAAATGDVSKTNAKAVFTGQIKFVEANGGSRVMTLEIPDSVMEKDTHRYHAEIPLDPATTTGATSAPTTKRQMYLDGHLENGKFGGTIRISNFNDYAGTFSLRRAGSAVAAIAAGIKDDSQKNRDAYDSLNYQGATVFNLPGNPTRATGISVYEPRGTDGDDFARVFSPVRSVEVTFSYGGAFQIFFPKTDWNQSKGTLSSVGDFTIPTTTMAFRLGFQCTQPSADNVSSLACKLFSGNRPLLATANFNIADTSEVNDQDPGNSGQLQAVSLEGYGFREGVRTSGAWAVDALYPALTRADDIWDLLGNSPEKKLLVVVHKLLDLSANRDSGVDITCTNVVWDKVNGYLNASNCSTPGVSTVNVYMLSCSNFHLTDTKGIVNCKYYASMNALQATDLILETRKKPGQ